MAESQTDSDKLNESRRDVLRFAQRLGELRPLLKAYIDSGEATVTRLGYKTGISWGALQGLLHGNSAIAVESKMYNLAQLVGMDEQAAKEVAALGPKVPHRYMGLLFLDENVIKLVFDLLVAHNGLSPRYTVATFSKAFEPYDQVVLGACSCNRGSLKTLQDKPAIADAIIDMLLDEKKLQLKLEEARKDQLQKREAVIIEINRRVEELLPEYDSKVDLVRKLGLPAGSLDYAKLAGASDVQVEKFLLILQKAMGEKDSPLADEEVEEVTTPAHTAKEVPVPDPFNGLAGETIHGVQHVLTAENFRKIEGISAEALVEALTVSAQTTIGLLALVTQIGSEEIRLLMRRPKIRRAVRELYNAIEASSATDPSPLLAMFDEQRALQFSLPDTTRKGDVK